MDHVKTCFQAQSYAALLGTTWEIRARGRRFITCRIKIPQTSVKTVECFQKVAAFHPKPEMGSLSENLFIHIPNYQ